MSVFAVDHDVAVVFDVFESGAQCVDILHNEEIQQIELDKLAKGVPQHFRDALVGKVQAVICGGDVVDTEP